VVGRRLGLMGDLAPAIMGEGGHVDGADFLDSRLQIGDGA
jgi:hypothetical protein